jgi:hypothetical protein
LIFEISHIQVLVQPVYDVVNITLDQLMHLIRLPKVIDIANQVLPKLVLDWMNGKRVQNINTRFIQKLQLNMLISSVIKWSTSGMLDWHTLRKDPHQA